MGLTQLTRPKGYKILAQLNKHVCTGVFYAVTMYQYQLRQKLQYAAEVEPSSE